MPSLSDCISITATSIHWQSTSPAACTDPFIVDPAQGRPAADEMVMVMHGYNTTFDGQGNQLYAVNGISRSITCTNLYR